MRRLLLSLTCCLLAVQPGLAEDITGVEFVRCYDGDTCTVNIPGLPDVFGKNISVRLVGIDTPELYGLCLREVEAAVQARRMLNAKLKAAQTVVLQGVSRDKYFRIDATVLADGLNLNAYLVEQGLARPYDGGKRQGWCS